LGLGLGSGSGLVLRARDGPLVQPGEAEHEGGVALGWLMTSGGGPGGRYGGGRYVDVAAGGALR